MAGHTSHYLDFFVLFCLIFFIEGRQMMDRLKWMMATDEEFIKDMKFLELLFIVDVRESLQRNLYC